MPNTVSSRSCGPEPDTRITTGGLATPSGFVNDAARLKPLAGMNAASSRGWLNESSRDITPDRSSRTTASEATGMANLASRPRESTQTSTCSAPPGFWNDTSNCRSSYFVVDVSIRRCVIFVTVACTSAWGAT
ncbi:MAG: hypothetical protein IPL75_20940 [Acidobacteria bacterium]|nr:hypothetical protein [Acidobacteriota bacterium]